MKEIRKSVHKPYITLIQGLDYMKKGFIYTIKDLPISERPRERLVKQGVKALSDAELLAVILRTGTRYENVVELAKRMLKEFNIKELSQASLNQLKGFSGINNAKACQLIASFELGKRVYAFNKAEQVFINNSRDVVKLLKPELSFLKREHFVGLYLDSRNCLLRKETISIGGLNTSIVHPREIFKIAIQESANAVIVVHNHPSGNAKPSKDDIGITKKLVKASHIVGICLLDHVIIGENTYVSMAEKNLVDF